jgi:calcium/proton exchanger cax
MKQVGNAAEHFTAVSVSVKDKIDLSISVAVGSSIQIALFVIPVIQLLAWCISKPLTLMFDRMSFLPPTLTLLSKIELTGSLRVYRIVLYCFDC